MTFSKFRLCCLILCTILIGCAINPVTGDRDFVTISEAEEIAQGQEYHQSIIKQYGYYDDPALQQYVNDLGQKLAANSHRSHLTFTFSVLDAPDINAFALPGGYIYVTRGIMAYLNSEAELAGVLGHEIGHVTARHSVRQQSGQLASNLLSILVSATTGIDSLGQLSQQLSTGLIKGYGRKHELEADRLGAEYLHQTRYNPETMLEVIGVLKDQETYEKALARRQNREANIYHGVYSSHPKNDDRLKTVIRAAKNLSPVIYQDDNQDKYLEMINGLAWGQSIKQGLVRNQKFLHPGLGFTIEFPPKWLINNLPTSLIAADAKSKAVFQLNVAELDENETVDNFLMRQLKNSQLDVIQQHYGATARTEVVYKGQNQPARVTAIKLKNNQVLFLIGTSEQAKFASTDARLLQINESFSLLSSSQLQSIKMPEIKVINRNSKTGFADLARASGISFDAENIIRLLNRAFPDGDISTYTKLKTVVSNDGHL